MLGVAFLILLSGHSWSCTQDVGQGCSYLRLFLRLEDLILNLLKWLLARGLSIVPHGSLHKNIQTWQLPSFRAWSRNNWELYHPAFYDLVSRSLLSYSVISESKLSRKRLHRIWTPEGMDYWGSSWRLATSLTIKKLIYCQNFYSFLFWYH